MRDMLSDIFVVVAMRNCANKL